jgi:hypothetical protein
MTDDDLDAEYAKMRRFASSEGEAAAMRYLDSKPGLSFRLGDLNHRRMTAEFEAWKAKQAQLGASGSEGGVSERRVNPVTWCPVLLFCI